MISLVRRVTPPPVRRRVGAWRRAARDERILRGIEPQLVWVFGSPRSGSTWLLLLLTEHPTVVPVNEPLIGLYLGPFLSDLPGWRTQTLDAQNFTHRRLQAGKHEQFFATEFADIWLPSLRDMLLRRFAAHAIRYARDGVPPER